MKRIPSNFKQEILQLLENQAHPKEIAEKFNLNYISTQQMCNKLGYFFRPNQGNVRYFQIINSYLKGYFLGFICADGAIVKNSLTITINAKDKYLLEKLKSEIGNKHEIKHIHTPISYDKSRNVDHVRFVLTNKDLISDLNSYGIYPKKSMTIGNVIQNIPKQFRNAFIIGYLDGDGSVFLPKGSSKFVKRENKIVTYPSYTITASFRGTKEFLQGIADHLNLNHSHIFFSNTYILNIGNKNDILKLFNCYTNLSFYLSRKHDRFLQRINHESYKKLMQD